MGSFLQEASLYAPELMLCCINGSGPAGSGDRPSTSNAHKKMVVTYFSRLSAKLVFIF